VAARALPELQFLWRGRRLPKREQTNNVTHASRVIAVYDMELDRTVAYQCPDCHKQWPITNHPLAVLDGIDWDDQ
jgi:hypothetical protein